MRESLILVLAVAGATTAMAQNSPINPATEAPGPQADNQAAAARQLPFLAQAAQADMAEVNTGVLAERKGQKVAVKSYGKMMATDHSKHHARVMALARDKGVNVPAGVNPEQRAVYNNLATQQGTAFDTAYKQHMVEAHRKAIALYEANANSADAETAALIRETLPVLKKHLAEAQAL